MGSPCLFTRQQALKMGYFYGLRVKNSNHLHTELNLGYLKGTKFCLERKASFIDISSIASFKPFLITWMREYCTFSDSSVVNLKSPPCPKYAQLGSVFQKKSCATIKLFFLFKCVLYYTVLSKYLKKNRGSPCSFKKPGRQSQIVQSVMQDYQYDLSHLLPVCNNNLQLLFVKTVRYCGVLRWISLILNSFTRWTSKRDNFILSTTTFVTWYFCFPRKVCHMIPLFSQKKNVQKKLAFFLWESNEIKFLLMKEKEEEWFCFIQEANFHFIDKQLLI